MNIEQAVDSVNSFFMTNWEAATEVPIFWDETPKNMIPSDDSTTDNPQVSAFVVVRSQILSGTQVTIGAAPNRRFRRNGILTARIMTPQEQGHLLEDQLANIVFDSLEGECTPEGVEFFNVTPLEPFRVGAFLVKQINVEFEYDEIK